MERRNSSFDQIDWEIGMPGHRCGASRLFLQSSKDLGNIENIFSGGVGSRIGYIGGQQE